MNVALILVSLGLANAPEPIAPLCSLISMT